jgi:predicted lysophospholipase L1 biosynthesis ABC-type transport system permease subunit
VASVDPAVPLAEFHTQTALIDRLLRTERLLGFVSGAFGVIALALAAIGLSGLLAYTVSRRTNEIGVRMALGAGGRDVIRMVLRDSLWLAGAGVLVGLPCAFAVAKFLQSALFSVEPLDVGTSLFALSILCGVALPVLTRCAPFGRNRAVPLVILPRAAASPMRVRPSAFRRQLVRPAPRPTGSRVLPSPPATPRVQPIVGGLRRTRPWFLGERDPE